MKFAPHSIRSRRGMALVIVLGVLLLITGLVVSFLVQAGGERTSSHNYLVEVNVRQLVDTTVNLVCAQIDNATTQGGGSVWASQPGALRLFGEDGSLKTIYKLYSATSLTSASFGTLASEDVPPPTWRDSPALWLDLNAPVDTATQRVFPILDARDPGAPNQLMTDLPGFELRSPPGASNDAAATEFQPAPMPVRWLYLTRSGKVVAPTLVNGEEIQVPGANADDPITGRIAFWTDDETAKVNVNTAADGVFWDTPRFDAADERKRARFQPAAGEYQRYPGHPATTRLGSILRALEVPLDPFPSPAGQTSGFYKLLPRYNDDYGSRRGTTIPTALPTAREERLYASVGEMLFFPNRDTTGATRGELETGGFFLTSQSRAPELNAFGKPRVAIWPIHQTNSEAFRTAKDQLIAFCSTVNGHPYYFTRQDPRNCTTDISLARNGQLLDYLDRASSNPFPGVGGKFSDKYGVQESRQILTEIFDYIRCANLIDSTVAQPYTKPLTTANKRQAGEVMPARHATWGTQGFGRFNRITEFSLVFMGVGRGVGGGNPAVAVPTAQAATTTPAYTGTAGTRVPAADTIAVQAYLLMNLFDPGQGWANVYPQFMVEIENLNSLTLNGQPLLMPALASTEISYGSTYGNHARHFGGPVDWRAVVGSKRFGTASGRYPFYSNIMEVPTASGTMELAGGEIRVRIKDMAGNEISNYRVKFPPSATTLKVPGVSTNPFAGSTDTNDRFKLSQTVGYQNTMLDSNNDVVFSMVPVAAQGDYRLLARNEVPNTYFVAHPEAGTKRMAYGFDTPIQEFPDSARGRLLADGSVATGRQPFVPATVQGAFIGGGISGTPGDWDNGTATLPDGPYINKPDEGTKANMTATSYPYFTQDYALEELGPTLFSPNRQLPSPVMFGSLPTGVISGKPWQTLLFRPGPTGHPGAGSPADHYLLDLFWMPIVEPYAISEPFSTAGKVNLNYQILPFTYLHRSAAVRAVLESEEVTQVGKMSGSYHRKTANNGATDARKPLNLDETNGTLRQFKAKFDAGDIFRSATEICDVFLVPEGKSWTSDAAARSAWYGDDFIFVGDNVRERPYANLLGRFTTKSNVYRVYYTVQAIQPPRQTPDIWNEKKGVILGEYRGSSTVERYLDPTSTLLPDHAADAAAPSLETSYRWRVVEHSQFAP